VSENADDAVTGPEHYQAAERLLQTELEGGGVHDPDLLQRAQVHAMLALAAATALGASSHGGPNRTEHAAMPYDEQRAWTQVAGEPDDFED
jgi:hypothetical protein